jgi:hypothetical protein
MADSAASLTELIAAGHFVAESHVSVEDRLPIGATPQSLCGIQYDKSHGSLTATDEGNCVQNENESGPDKTRLMRTHESTLYTRYTSCMHTRSPHLVTFMLLSIAPSHVVSAGGVSVTVPAGSPQSEASVWKYLTFILF